MSTDLKVDTGVSDFLHHLNLVGNGAAPLWSKGFKDPEMDSDLDSVSS